jgi:hypothetical protein
MARRDWHMVEEQFLIENYDKLTIKELQDGLKSLSFREKMRSPDSINSKIKRLKSEGKLDGYKKEEVVKRALKQRGK